MRDILSPAPLHMASTTLDNLCPQLFAVRYIPHCKPYGITNSIRHTKIFLTTNHSQCSQKYNPVTNVEVNVLVDSVDQTSFIDHSRVDNGEDRTPQSWNTTILVKVSSSPLPSSSLSSPGHLQCLVQGESTSIPG